MKLIRLICCLFVTSFVGSCTESPDAVLDRGVNHAQKAFEQLRSSELARLSFQDMIQQGATLVTYVTSSVSTDSKLPTYIADGPARKWSVVLRQDEESGEVIIEGFGGNLKTPIITKRVTLPEFE